MRLHRHIVRWALASILLVFGCKDSAPKTEFRFQTHGGGRFEIAVADVRQGGKPVFIKLESDQSKYLNIFNNLRKSRSGPRQKLTILEIVKIRFSGGDEEVFALYSDNWWHHGDSWYH
jgi:hypothetical protein